MNSMGTPDINMSPEVYQAFMDLRTFMYQQVYTNPVAKGEEVKARRMLKMLYEYYQEHPEDMPEKYFRALADGEESKDRVIADYISGMTDQYASTKFSEYFMPKSWDVDGE